MVNLDYKTSQPTWNIVSHFIHALLKWCQNNHGILFWFQVLLSDVIMPHNVMPASPSHSHLYPVHLTTPDMTPDVTSHCHHHDNQIRQSAETTHLLMTMEAEFVWAQIVISLLVVTAFVCTKTVLDRVRRRHARATVVVVGAGPVGLTATLVAAHSGRAGRLVVYEELSKQVRIQKISYIPYPFYPSSFSALNYSTLQPTHDQLTLMTSHCRTNLMSSTLVSTSWIQQPRLPCHAMTTHHRHSSSQNMTSDAPSTGWMSGKLRDRTIYDPVYWRPAVRNWHLYLLLFLTGRLN